jgi:hypothetical protein
LSLEKYVPTESDDISFASRYDKFSPKRADTTTHETLLFKCPTISKGRGRRIREGRGRKILGYSIVHILCRMDQAMYPKRFG